MFFFSAENCDIKLNFGDDVFQDVLDFTEKCSVSCNNCVRVWGWNWHGGAEQFGDENDEGKSVY